MYRKLIYIFYTVKELKPVQIYFQCFYKLRKVFKRKDRLHYEFENEECHLLNFEPIYYCPPSTTVSNKEGSTEFSFLNKKVSFEDPGVDWNYSEYGKLWAYNLNYFEFLFSDINEETGSGLIQSYCDKNYNLKDGIEPYPISLRGINWIKFFCKEQVSSKEYNKVLFTHYKVLSSSIEYHLLANHLLENGISLLFGAYYFKNEFFYQKAKTILQKELIEQILPDGAHFERSPMYHKIVLYRLLDCCNLVKNNVWKNQELLGLLVDKVSLMLGWLSQMTVGNNIPMFQDSAPMIAPSSIFLKEYANVLNINTKNIRLKESGYRRIDSKSISIFFNVGKISPAYQPGHAHADELNFVLFNDGRPVIVDTGISTYEKNERRQLERSTSSHNCITINGQNSSQVWGGFRVAKRANLKLHIDNDTQVEAEHNGYKRYGICVRRKLEKEGNKFLIQDRLESKSGNFFDAKMNLHFHPDVKVTLNGNVLTAGGISMVFNNYQKLTLKRYMFAAGFNKLKEATRVCLETSSLSQIIIQNAN